MTLLRPGMKATYRLPDGSTYAVTIGTEGQPDEDRMTRPISTYHVFKFGTGAEALDAHHRITQLLKTATSVPYLQDDPAKRAVILSGPSTTLYLSPGALEVAILLWIKLPTSTVTKSDDLPKDLILIFGETDDLPR